MKMKKSTVVNGIELRHVIGQGGFGRVMLGYDTKQKRDVAVKVIDKALVKENNLEPYVEREISMMRTLQHEHVVRLITAFDTNKAYYLVMELATGGELFDKIVESKRFDEDTARNYFQQLISAVHYCHTHKIVHRDLKAENLLLGPRGDLKVCDFGLSRYTTKSPFTDNPIVFTSLAGSTDYQAPEVLREGGYQGSSCDIWSCAVILFFMLCGYLPFADKSDELTRKRILNCDYFKTSKYLPEGAKDLIAHMLKVNPQERFDTKKIIDHPWFRVKLDPSLFPANCLQPSDSPTSASTPKSSPTTGGLHSITRSSSGQHLSDSPDPGSPVHANPREQLHQAFVSCNVDRTGYLTHDEVRDVLIKLNNETPVDEDEVKDFMSKFQLDEQGRITEEQFMLGWQRNIEAVEQPGMHRSGKYSLSRLCNVFHFEVERELIAELRKAFDELDGDHSGLLNPQTIAKMNLGLTCDEITTLFHMMDPSHPEKAAMSFENFVNFCTKYDLLQKHPIAMRLRRLETLFDATDFQTFRHVISTGFTVAGLRDIIITKIASEAPSQISTEIEQGETQGYLYGTMVDGEGKRILQMGIQLLPAVQGYTKVLAYRIGGKTEHFHQWFRNFRKLLMKEILTCAEDTAVIGESELM